MGEGEEMTRFTLFLCNYKKVREFYILYTILKYQQNFS